LPSCALLGRAHLHYIKEFIINLNNVLNYLFKLYIFFKFIIKSDLLAKKTKKNLFGQIKCGKQKIMSF
jgi:hypothetical protein